MDEAWERAVEAALATAGGELPARSLTLDGAVKCPHGRLPATPILEKHQSLEHLSIAGVGVASLAGFPRLRNLTRLTLSDNRIAGGLDHLVAAGLAALRDLDLSNNRIGCLDDLAPLAHLHLVSLDLYECPVTRVKDYRSRVFGMIRTLKYLDKMDADENERPESDDEDDDEDGDGDDVDEEDEEEDDVEDPVSGEMDGEESRQLKPLPELNGVDNGNGNGVIDVDEEESDADEEEGVSAAVGPTRGVDEEEDDEDEDDEDYEEDLGEEIEEEDLVEVHDALSSEEDVDGVEEEEYEENEETAVDEQDEEEDVEDEEEGEDGGQVSTTGRRVVVEGDGGEIDGHEQGEEDGDGEIGEAEEDEQLLGVQEDDRVYEEGNGNDDDEDDEDEDTEYLVQPIPHPQQVTVGSDFDANDEDDDGDEEVDDDEGDHHETKKQPSSSNDNKRKRGDDEPDGAAAPSDADEEDDGVEDLRPFKHH